MTYWEDLCLDLFNSTPMINRTRKEFAFYRQAGTNTVFTNGVEDPWQYATERKGVIEFGQTSLMSDCTDCGHCAELYTPKPSDSMELVRTRKIVAKLISDWLMYNP